MFRNSLYYLQASTICSLSVTNYTVRFVHKTDLLIGNLSRTLLHDWKLSRIWRISRHQLYHWRKSFWRSGSLRLHRQRLTTSLRVIYRFTFNSQTQPHTKRQLYLVIKPPLSTNEFLPMSRKCHGLTSFNNLFCVNIFDNQNKTN